MEWTSYTLRMSEGQLADWKRYAASQRLPLAHIVREAVERTMAEQPEPWTPPQAQSVSEQT